MSTARLLWKLAILISIAAVVWAVVYSARRGQRSLAPAPDAAESLSCQISLSDVTQRTGITFVHTDGSCGQRYIPETVTAGLASFDYDGDGLVDIYFLNGAPLRGAKADVPPRNALYRNEGGWKFRDVTQSAGVGDTGFGVGVTVADYDNDGHQDLFVNNYGPNILYHNNGDGTFSDVTDRAGVEGGHQLGAGAGFLDMDADGDLDLYVANYVTFTYETHQVQYDAGFPQYVGPREYPFEPDLVYRNEGDGAFTDVSKESGVGGHAGSGMGLVCADYDNDGDADVFVLNDVAANFLFNNDGSGKFTEVGLLAGAAYNANGDALGSMGIDCGDYDNDGWLDFFMTSYQNELPVLYRNMHNGTFEDVTVQTGAGAGAFNYVNWGTGLVDFDNDGDRDLYVANGHLQDNIDLFDKTSAYRVRNVVLENVGGTFVDVSDRCGDGMRVEQSSRGAVFDDLDNDGDSDVVVLNSRAEPTVLRNDGETANHWIQICLHGVRANRDGVGTRVQVIAGDLVQIDEVISGRGYQSHWGTRLRFGLGLRDRVDRIEVRWLGGGVDVLEDVQANRLLTITEGAGQTAGARLQNGP